MKSKWKVQCNPMNGKYLYIAYRVLNTDELVHSGNIETYGKYSEDKREIQKLVDELNETEELTHAQSACVGVAETGGTKRCEASLGVAETGGTKRCEALLGVAETGGT